jgi:hypothetical protein
MRCPIVRRLLLLILCVAATRSAAAENAADGRAVLDLNFDWRFIQTDVSGGEAEAIDDSPWRRIDLPHDWSIEGEYSQDAPAGGAGAYLPAGIGWYRREIDVPAEWVGKRLFIEIDAAQRNSDVWINGQHLGHRPYGYISFGYDLTAHQARPQRHRRSAGQLAGSRGAVVHRVGDLQPCAADRDRQGAHPPVGHIHHHAARFRRAR